MSKTGHWCSTAMSSVLVHAFECFGRTPIAVKIWLDTAQHFRNKCIFYEVPTTLFRTSAQNVDICFHAEHYGKTPLDASFRRAKEWVKLYLDFASVKSLSVTVEDAIRSAYAAAATAKEYRVLFLPGAPPSRPPRQLRISDVRKIQKIEARRDGSYAITNADGARSTRWAILTESAKTTQEKKSHVLHTKQQKPSYVGMIQKKFA